uniref:MADF domain-containing protein n=1 Tax=Rhodnius prolixus TaxID=13249 RepID=T1IDG9_RHOPR
MASMPSDMRRINKLGALKAAARFMHFFVLPVMSRDNALICKLSNHSIDELNAQIKDTVNRQSVPKDITELQYQSFKKDVEKLISAVFTHECLWNQAHPDHHNRFVLEKEWEEVSTSLNIKSASVNI